jgi:hypothetical protein
MQISKVKKLFLSLLLMLATPSLHAQLVIPGYVQRLDIGVSTIMASGQYTTHQFFNYATDTLCKNDTAITKSITGTGISESFNTFFPIKQIGRKCVLAVGVGFNFSVIAWENIDPIPTSIPTSPYNPDYIYTVGSVHYGFPVSLDVKWGSEAFITKKYELCGTLGAGINTSYNVATFTQSLIPFILPSNYSFSPFVKAEFGARYIGLNWKLRVMYTMDSYTLASIGNNSGVTVYDALATHKTELMSSGNLSVSLLVNPLAWYWSRPHWWSNYRTDD